MIVRCILQINYLFITIPRTWKFVFFPFFLHFYTLTYIQTHFIQCPIHSQNIYICTLHSMTSYYYYTTVALRPALTFIRVISRCPISLLSSTPVNISFPGPMRMIIVITMTTVKIDR